MNATDDADLPPALAVLWNRQAGPKRGPRPALSLDLVIQTAVEIADAEGLAHLSMSRVAERLGFTTMSLYRYVRSKDDLLVMMADTANGAAPPAATPGDWRGGLRTWTRQIFAAYRRHPWMLQIPVSGPPAGPSQLAWMDAGLQNLADLTLHEGYKLQIIQLLHGYARSEGQLSADLSRPDPAMDTAARYGQIIRRVTSPETHPALARLVGSGILDGPTAYDDEVDFGFGLETILDGIARLVSRQGPDRQAG
jgi:AcrR family transcriptional regulator